MAAISGAACSASLAAPVPWPPHAAVAWQPALAPPSWVPARHRGGNRAPGQPQRWALFDAASFSVAGIAGAGAGAGAPACGTTCPASGEGLAGGGSACRVAGRLEPPAAAPQSARSASTSVTTPATSTVAKAAFHGRPRVPGWAPPQQQPTPERRPGRHGTRLRQPQRARVAAIARRHARVWPRAPHPAARRPRRARAPALFSAGRRAARSCGGPAFQHAQVMAHAAAQLGQTVAQAAFHRLEAQVQALGPVPPRWRRPRGAAGKAARWASGNWSRQRSSCWPAARQKARSSLEGWAMSHRRAQPVQRVAPLVITRAGQRIPG